MKVFSKEVNHCKQCPCYSSEELASGAFGWCNVVEEHVSQEIPKDCPFNKPVTKEVIERFRFEKTSNKAVRCFEKGIYSLYWFGGNFISIDVELEEYKQQQIYRGTINNPVELEFILTSIGVIE